MDEVTLFGIFVDRVVLQVAIGLVLAGAAVGGGSIWRRTNDMTPFRTARCLLGAGALAGAALVAGYAGVVVLYVAGALFPAPLLSAVWPLGIGVCAAVTWASARALLPMLAAAPATAPSRRQCSS